MIKIRDIRIFKRTEKKYMISREQKSLLMEIISQNLIEDQYPHSTITSLYLDTPSRLLVRRSIEGGPYKEKLRLRGYGRVSEDSTVYLELKKKYKGTVYKRRSAMTLKEAKDYFESEVMPEESQINHELDYSMHLYGMPKPYIAIIYERDAYVAKEADDLRITFDSGIRYATENLFSSFGGEGIKILPNDMIIMEIKTEGAMPLWLSHTLDKMKIFPCSFSKYGRAYVNELNNSKRGTENANFV